MLAGTTAPVIALAAIIAAGTAVRGLLRVERGTLESVILGSVAISAAINIVLQIQVEVNSLNSLANGLDAASPGIATDLIVWGFALLLAPLGLRFFAYLVERQVAKKGEAGQDPGAGSDSAGQAKPDGSDSARKVEPDGTAPARGS